VPLRVIFRRVVQKFHFVSKNPCTLSFYLLQLNAGALSIDFDLGVFIWGLNRFSLSLCHNI
jgi:hypothetical protein